MFWSIEMETALWLVYNIFKYLCIYVVSVLFPVFIITRFVNKEMENSIFPLDSLVVYNDYIHFSNVKVCRYKLHHFTFITG